MTDSGRDTDQAKSVQYIEIDADAQGQRVDNYLMKILKGVPRSRVYKILRDGQVRVNKGRVKPSHKLLLGDSLRVPPVVMRAESDLAPKWLQLQVEDAICFENEDFIAINKPTGIAVHAGTGVVHGLIEALMASRASKQISLVHRIDKETSGLVLVAKGREALNAAVECFKQREVIKHYSALLGGCLNAERKVALALSRDQLQGGERMVQLDKNGAEAISVFTPQRVFDGVTRCDVQILTGRTHQIRVHSVSLGMPLVGDRKYGDRTCNKTFQKRGFKHMFLHSRKLALNPVGYAPLMLTAPLPTQWGEYA